MANFWEKLREMVSPPKPTDDSNLVDDSTAFEPLDEKFARLFNNAGGQFLYCDNMQEALHNLKKILEAEQIGRIICFEEKLQTLLNTVGVNFINYPSASVDFSLIHCESLIAFDGSIMISFHQTGGRKLSELPDNFIVFATPDQIQKNSSDALHVIKRKKSDNLPSNITCIRGKEMHNMDDIPNAKNIYLLLVEEQI